MHMVSACACRNRVVPGQVKSDRKSNETAAVPQGSQPYPEAEVVGDIFFQDDIRSSRLRACRRSKAMSW